MPASHKNRVKVTVSGTPGTGTITLGSASSGYQSLASAYSADATVDVVITDGSDWEVARNCAYTHSGTTLSRGTLEASSTGSALSLTSAAVVAVTQVASKGTRQEIALQGLIPGGRLTLESGVPVSTTDQTSKTSIYYTPFVHNVITLWDGADWVPVAFTEYTLALGTLTSGKLYDVFAYLSSGALALEMLVWTDDATRATAVTLQDGRYCKSGDKLRLYLGTFRTTSTTTTEDSGGGSTTQVGGRRFLWNAYNRVARHASVFDSTDSWSYTTDTIRQANAASGNKVELVVGLPLDRVDAIAHGVVYLVNNGARAAKVGVGVDSTTAFSGLVQGGFNGAAATGIYAVATGAFQGVLTPGYHYIAWLEKGAAGTSVFQGDNAGDGQQTGLHMRCFA